MTLKDEFVRFDAHYKKIAIHDTWSHLFPKGDYYQGTVRIAYSIYGNMVILDEKIDIEDSPWWHTAITEFGDKMTDDMKCGEVCEFEITVNITSHGDDGDEHTTIDIKQAKKTYLINPY